MKKDIPTEFGLHDLLKKIEKDREVPKRSKEGLFRGADIMVVKDKDVSYLKGEKSGFYPEPTYIITKNAEKISWAICQLRDVYADLLDYQNKYYFYGEIAKAANSYLSKNKKKENCKELLICIVKKAIKILPEFESGGEYMTSKH